MKILVHSLNYAPEKTGVGRYAGDMAAWLARRGHGVEVICGLPHYPEWTVASGYSGFWFRKEVSDGVKVFRARHYVPRRGRVRGRGRVWMELSFSFMVARYWIARLMSREKPTVIVAVIPPMQTACWPLIYGWVRRVPIVLHVQDLQVDAAFQLKMLRGTLVGKLLYAAEAWVLCAASQVATISPPMRRRIIEKGARSDRVWILPNWADVDAIRPEPRDNGFRATLGIGPEMTLVIYAGNMGEKQGLEVVLEAAAQLRYRRYLKFLLVGAGAVRGRLEKMAREHGLENIQFVGIQPNKKLSEVLAAGDIHLVVQRREAADLVMPSKLTNIFAAGRACIATAEPGTALGDTITINQVGVLTPPQNPTALAQAIDELAQDRLTRERLGKRAREFAERNLRRDAVLGEFERRLLRLYGEGLHD